MSEYETLKAEYENFKMRLSKLDTLREQARSAWSDAGYHGKETYKEFVAADKNFRDMRKSGRELVYKVAVLEHKELGTSLNKLFTKYGITTVTMKKLLREAGVAYLRPTLGQWLPIGTAPKDGTKFLALMRTSNIEIAFHTDGEYGGFRVDSYAPPMINEDWMEYWMPLPKPPKLG
jgi:hypothetical protein